MNYHGSVSWAVTGRSDLVIFFPLSSAEKETGAVSRTSTSISSSDIVRDIGIFFGGVVGGDFRGYGGKIWRLEYRKLSWRTRLNASTSDARFSRVTVDYVNAHPHLV